MQVSPAKQLPIIQYLRSLVTFHIMHGLLVDSLAKMIAQIMAETTVCAQTLTGRHEELANNS
jgi:hypothetical protein